MSKKSFFKERTIAEIERLKINRAYNQRNLVRTIDSLDPIEESLEIRVQIVPGSFYINVKSSKDASRKCLKHGQLISLSHPETKEACRKSPEIPLKIRARDFSALKEMKEEEINYVGYSMQPTWGDRIKRVFPFVFIPEGMRIFSYAETQTKGIEIDAYKDAKKVSNEGAGIVVEVPSRTRKQGRYKFKLVSVPVIRSPENLSTILTLRSSVLQDEETGEIVRGRTTHEHYNIRYKWEADREGSNIITFYPHDVAAYIKIAGEEWKQHNLTTMEFNPFALTSQHGADFYQKLMNNVLIYDPKLKNKGKLRKLHLAEKSILWARAIGVFGHDDFAYWDPARDGKLKDYDWKTKGLKNGAAGENAK